MEALNGPETGFRKRNRIRPDAEYVMISGRGSTREGPYLIPTNKNRSKTADKNSENHSVNLPPTMKKVRKVRQTKYRLL